MAIIAYENLIELKPEEFGEATNLRADNSGSGHGICVSLDTHDFDVRYQGGKASMRLSRHMTNDEAQKLGEALIKAAEANRKRDEEWAIISGLGTYPIPKRKGK